jgi:xanthine dehydrogenase/oxidase
MPTAKVKTKIDTGSVNKAKKSYGTDLQFFINGRKYAINDPDPQVLLADFLRSTETGLTGTKHSCGQGGCGACTVMLSYWDDVAKKPVNVSCNSCLRPIVALDGMEITTVEGLGTVNTEISPVQYSIAKNNGSQCGYCTPGFVMNMHSLLIEKKGEKLTKQEIEQSFDGNICRCTGFRPILYAMKTFASDWGPADEKGTPECYIDPGERVKHYKEPREINVKDLSRQARALHFSKNGFHWYRPLDLAEVHALMDRYKGGEEVKLVCGNTSQGIPGINPVNPTVLIDISNIDVLKQTVVTGQELIVGAATTYNEFLNLINKTLKKATPAQKRGLKTLHYMAIRTAGKIVRNVASLAGNTMLVARNVKSGYPFPSDLFMALAALGTCLDVSVDGKIINIPILDFIKLYNKDESFSQQAIIVAYHIPHTTIHDHIQTYKVALRKENSHSLANAGFKVTLDKGKKITAATLVMGGITTQPFLAEKTARYLIGKNFDAKTMKEAIGVLSKEIEGVFRSLPKWYVDLPTEGVSNAYRLSLLQGYLYKFFIEVLSSINPSAIPAKDISAPKVEFDRPVSKGQQQYKNYATEFPVSLPVIKLSAFEQATGEAIYTHDIPVPVKGLQGAFVTGGRALAKFHYQAPDAKGNLKKTNIDGVLKHIKTKFPDVVDYITYRDIPAGGANGIADKYAPDPNFCVDKITCYGQCIGLVITPNEQTAIKAAQYISDNCLAYTESTPILEIREAVKAHELFPSYKKDDNHLIKNPGSSIKWALKTGAKGLEPGFKFGKVTLNGINCEIIAGLQQTGDQVHFYMETQSCFITPGERQQMLVQSSTQSPSSVQSAVAHTLNVKESDIELEVKRVGGAYGGKTTRTPFVAAPAAVAGVKLRRPIRIAMAREVDSYMTGNRHPFLGEFNIAIVADGPQKGKIMGTVFEFFSNGGNTLDCSFDVMDCAILGADNCYNVSNFQTQGHVCKTNRSSNGAMRSYGGIQCGLITEEAIEAAAHRIGMLAEDIREKNFYAVGDKTPYGQDLEYCIISDVWKRLKKSSDFDNRLKAVEKFNRENKWKKRGISMIPIKYGLGYNLGFLMQGGALIDIYVSDGSVLVSHGGVEMGQGVMTKIAQVAADTLNIPLGLIEMDETRTSVVPNAIGTGATSSSDLNGGAVRQACIMQRKKLEAMCMMLLQQHGSDWCTQQGINYWDHKNGWQAVLTGQANKSTNQMIWNNVISMANENRVDLSSQALYRTPGLGNSLDQQFYGFTYSACCSEVEIDVLTGESNILRSDILYDIGKSLNPAIDIGQIEGAFVMGVGNVLTEKVVWEPKGTPNPAGMLNTPNTWTYKPPCAATIPIDLRVDLFPREDASEVPDNPNLLMSSKGVGEPPLVLANTVFFAIKRAVLAARKDRGHDEWFEMESPAVVEEIRKLCLVNVKDLVF